MHWLKDERNTEIRTFLDWQDRHRRKKYNISVQYSGTFALVRCTAFRNQASKQVQVQVQVYVVFVILADTESWMWDPFSPLVQRR